MDSHNECSLSNEVATQACDQCYRCKLRCSRTQPACHRCQGIGSACTWSMGKWLGKPKSTKRKVDDGKEQAELTRGQQECPSPGKKTAASRYRSQSGDEAYIPEEGNTPFLWILVHCSDIRRVVWSNSKSAEGAPPVTEKRTDIYATTGDWPSDCLQIPGEALSSEEDSFLLWPLTLEMPPKKLNTPAVEKQPFRPASRILAGSTTFQHSKSPPDRDAITFSNQVRSERAAQDEEGSLITKPLDSYNGDWAGPSPKSQKFSHPSRGGHSTDLISPPDSSSSRERQDQPEEYEISTENYQSHVNKPVGPSCKPTEVTRQLCSPLPLLSTDNSVCEQARISHQEDPKAAQELMNRSRHGYHGRTQTEMDSSLVENQHASIKPHCSRSLQSPIPSCSCLSRLLESLGQSDPLILATKLLSACEASTRCKSCYTDELAFLQRLMGLQKVYTCLYLLHEDNERSPSTCSRRAGLQDRHGDKQAGQASLMHEYNRGSRDVELEDRRNPPGEEGRDCTSDIAEDVRMLLIRAVTLVSQEEMLSISCRPRVGDVYSLGENSVLSFRVQISILLKKFRALLGLESG